MFHRLLRMPDVLSFFPKIPTGRPRLIGCGPYSSPNAAPPATVRTIVSSVRHRTANGGAHASNSLPCGGGRKKGSTRPPSNVGTLKRPALETAYWVRLPGKSRRTKTPSPNFPVGHSRHRLRHSPQIVAQVDSILFLYKPDGLLIRQEEEND